MASLSPAAVYPSSAPSSSSLSPSSPSSSSPSPSSPNRRPHHSDVFRPKLPLDPFAHIYQPPWHVSIDSLLSLSAAPTHRDVILVLGTPSPQDLHPLLHSPLLSSSLLILATHAPPPIPTSPSPQPAIRILHLSTPLAIEDSGALRLVSLLERAERVARAWRADPESYPNGSRTIQLGEQEPGGEFTVVSVPALSANYAPSFTTQEHHYTPPVTNANSLEQLTRYPSPASTTNSSLLSSSSLSFSSSRPKSTIDSKRKSSASLPKSSSKKHPKSDPTQRPFDALINFLPSCSQSNSRAGALPDKSLLKHAILTTTISHPFLSTAVPPSPPSPYRRPRSPSPHRVSRRGSLFSAFPSSDASPSTSRTSSPAPTPPPSSPSSSRWSTALLRRSSVARSVYSAPQTPLNQSHDSLPTESPPLSSPKKSHIIHILPPGYPTTPSPPPRPTSLSLSTIGEAPAGGKPKLVQSLEQFLLSFAYPSLSSIPYPNPNNTETERPAPYILPCHVLGESAADDSAGGGESGWTVVEMALLGLLDPPTNSGAPKRGDRQSQTLGGLAQDPGPRAWIARGGDVRITAGGRASADEHARYHRPQSYQNQNQGISYPLTTPPRPTHIRSPSGSSSSDAPPLPLSISTSGPAPGMRLPPTAYAPSRPVRAEEGAGVRRVPSAGRAVLRRKSSSLRSVGSGSGGAGRRPVTADGGLVRRSSVGLEGPRSVGADESAGADGKTGAVGVNQAGLPTPPDSDSSASSASSHEGGGRGADSVPASPGGMGGEKEDGKEVEKEKEKGWTRPRVSSFLSGRRVSGPGDVKEKEKEKGGEGKSKKTRWMFWKAF